MARFYGTVSGKGKTDASRLGNDNSGLRVTAQSYEGDIVVTFYPESDGDWVSIGVRKHADSGSIMSLYYGRISELLSGGGRAAIIRKFAEEALAKHAKGD